MKQTQNLSHMARFPHLSNVQPASHIWGSLTVCVKIDWNTVTLVVGTAAFMLQQQLSHCDSSCVTHEVEKLCHLALYGKG